jgi:hypothetical protein
MMRTTPWRRTTLHFTQIFRTDDLTFIVWRPRYGLGIVQACAVHYLAEPLILHEK